MKMRLDLAILFLWFASGLGVAAQQPGSANTASIRGTVIDVKTSQPLVGATVVLHGQGASAESNSASTAPDGKFTFNGLAAGRYRLSVSRNGYAESGAGRGAGGLGTAVTLAAGQQIDDAVLRLTPTGVISGRIVNERDEPLPGVYVQSMKSSYRSGHRELADARSGVSDDRGEFRIWGLAPGQYYVRATYPRSGANGRGAHEIYVPMFYPGVNDPGQAQAVDLHAGDELSGINFNLSPSRTVHVKGRVVTANAAPAKSAEVTLAQAVGSGGYSVEASTDAAGKFDIAAVPAGSYIASAELSENPDSSKPLMGHSAVQVGDANIDSVEVVVYPGATVSIHLRIDGDRKVTLGRISASLKSLENSAGQNFAEDMRPAQVQADGTFVFHDVPEGTYRVVLTSLPDGYYVRSAEDGAEASVLVSHGHAGPAEIRLASGAARIQGTVYKNKNNEEAAPSATVALIPDGQRRFYSEYYRQAATDQSGNFTIANVPPGDYSLFAWQDIDRTAYIDPNFMQQYQDSGRPIHVEEGGNNTGVQLQLATAAQE
jgi:uncharacterized protein (DUF2141 family)